MLPHWRKPTWALLIWTALFGISVWWAISAASGNCVSATGDNLTLCQGGTAALGWIGVTFLFAVWVACCAILSLVWLRKHLLQG